MTHFDDVGEFHHKFGLPMADETTAPCAINDETFLYRYQHLLEELHELLKAHRDSDLVGVADALADLVYVALGTAHFYHLPFDAVFAEVQRANMEKERATSAKDERSKRASAFDIVKPEGWQAPNIKGVLQKVGVKVWK